MKTPCHFDGDYDPELWVSDNHADRAEAIRICRTECPSDLFAACARLAKVDPIGVMAGVDHHKPKTGRGKGKECAVCGVRNFSNTGPAPRTCAGCIETKVCDGCGVTFKRSKQSNVQWAAARFCGNACSARATRNAA